MSLNTGENGIDYEPKSTRNNNNEKELEKETKYLSEAHHTIKEIYDLLQEPGALYGFLKKPGRPDEYERFLTPYHVQMISSLLQTIDSNESKEVDNNIAMIDEYSNNQVYDTWMFCMHYYNSNDN